MAGAGGDVDELICSGINPLFLQVPVELQQKVGISTEVVGTSDDPEGEALLVHAVSKCPQRCWTQLRKVALHHICLEEVDKSNLTLDPAPAAGYCHGGAAW